MSEVARHEYCVVALADTFRGDGEVLASPIGTLPAIAARLAKLSFEPGLLLTDGIATLLGEVPALGSADAISAEGYMPYRRVFDVVWSGRRHVVMGATQIDRYGNQNISALGDWQKPKTQLLGMRGAPGNTIHHPTSYFVPKHSRRVFVEKVDVVSGVGYDRARALGARSSRFHEIRRVVSNLGVFDFETADKSMRLASLHPGVTLENLLENTSFQLSVPAEVPVTRTPSTEELRLIREVIDPKGLGARELEG
ncbi:MAG TPA: CoA-transferase [Polyangiaceae bacterium]|nr:CoA-transferase [Polyangiaceae bacterium]